MRKIILLSLFALLTVFSAWAYDFEVDGIYYNHIPGTDDQVEVTYGGDGSVYTGTVAIPATVTYEGVTYAVTSIGFWAFSTCPGLTSVVIPESVTSIGWSAFLDCSGLTSVVIPESVMEVGERAFDGCTSISAPLHNSKVFAYMPEDYSGEYAIPSGIQTIAGGAFYGCSSLTSVTIPESVTEVGYIAFKGCTSISAPLYNSKVFAYMPEDYSGEYAIPSGIQTIAIGAFEGCRGPISVTVPNSMSTIGCWAFRWCSGLTSVTIPNSVTSIEGEAFKECSSLTSVTIPNSVTSIEGEAFKGCSSLTSVTIPGSVTSIAWGAFVECSGLTSVILEEGVDTIWAYAFAECSGLTSVVIPESVTEVDGRAFYGTAISSPLHNSKIFAYMPENYKGAYEIPSGIQSIAGWAFVECSGLTSVTIPNSVTSIEEEAFSGCSGLTSVTIPESVTFIGAYAFVECSGLTSVVIPNSVTSIGESAFWGCSGLTSVILPESLDTIEWRAFHCDSLRDVYCLAENPPVCDYGAFSVHENLYVPRGSKSAYGSAEGWGRFKAIYEFGFDGTGWVMVQANDESMGRVTGSGEYELDELVTLEAIPNDGYHFVKWDDDNTDNPRRLKVTADITLTAIFAKNGVANESSLFAAPFAYVQGRTAYLADGLGEVEAFMATGQRVYRGFDRTIELPRPGVYVLRVVADGRRSKVVVR